MKPMPFYVAALIIFCGSINLSAQVPQTSPEHQIFKQEEGVWDAEVKMWMGEGEPSLSQATETNKMVGEFWLVSDFNGQMMGAPFVGHGFYGYDPQAKKYMGTWIDSFSPHAMQMEGTYDTATKTMTLDGKGMGPDGNPMNHRLTTTYRDDGTRVMTMHAPNPDGSDSMVKIMEVTYTKKR